MNTAFIAIVLLIFLLPIYLPFVVSFAFRSPDLREIRHALRIASAIAFVVSLVAILARPDYGNDVAGNMRGAGHNIAWVWGSDVLATVVSVATALHLRAARTRKSQREGASNKAVARDVL